MSVDGQSLLDQAYGEVQGLQAAAQTALGNLTTAASLPFLSWFDMAKITPFAPANPAAIALHGAPTNVKPVDTALAKPAARLKITLDSLPQMRQATLESAPDFNYNPELFTDLENQVMAILTSGGQDIAPAVQDAVFNQGHERLMQTTRDSLDLTGARTGSKGCRYPNSMTKAQQNEIILTFTWQRSDLSREIVRTMADLAAKNLQAALAAGVSIEQAKADIALKVFTTLLEAQRLVVEKFRAETEAYLAEFEGHIKAITLELEAEKLDQSIELEYLAGVRDQLRLESAQNVAEFEGQLKSALARLDADKTNGTFQVEWQNQLLKKWETETVQLIERGKAQIQQSEQANSLRLKAIESLATSFIEIAKAISVQGVSIVTQKK
jgi:hypothetical protein